MKVKVNKKEKLTVGEELYHILLEDIRNILVYPILGKDYYNYGADSRSCNKFMIEDLSYKYNRLKSSNNILRCGFGISIVLNIILIAIINLGGN